MTILEQYVEMGIIKEDTTPYGKLYSLPYSTYMSDKLDTVSISWDGALIDEDGQLIVRPHQIPTHISDYPAKILAGEMERGYLYVYDAAGIEEGDEVNLVCVGDQIIQTYHDTVTELGGDKMVYAPKPGHTVHGIWTITGFMILSVLDNVKGWVLDYREMVSHYGDHEHFEVVSEQTPVGDITNWPSTYRIQSVEYGGIISLRLMCSDRQLHDIMLEFKADYEGVWGHHGLTVGREYYQYVTRYVRCVTKLIDMDLITLQFDGVFDPKKPKRLKNTFEYNNLSAIKKAYVDKVLIDGQEFDFFDDEIINLVG